jgi:Flp pilus assembly protein protease CpaA
MFELLRVFIAIIGSSVAGLYDLKTTNIPDSVAIAMIVIGFSIHTYEGLITGNFSNLVDASMFCFILFLFSFLMYRAGQWGGGDGELLIGIAALLPAYPLTQTLFPFPISFFINTFFVGVVYSMAFVFLFVLKNEKTRKGFWYSFSKALTKGFYKRIPTKNLKVDDMLGEDIPELKLSKRILRGLKANEIEKIKKIKRYVVIKEGIRYGPVFPLALIITLLYGDIILFIL